MCVYALHMFDLYYLWFCHFRTAKVPPLDTFHLSDVCKLGLFEPQVQEHSPQGCLLQLTKFLPVHCTVSCHVLFNDGRGAATTETSINNQLPLQRWSFRKTLQWLLIWPTNWTRTEEIWNTDGPKMVWKMFSKWWKLSHSGFSGATLWNPRAHPSKNSKVKPSFTLNCSTFLAHH